MFYDIGSGHGKMIMYFGLISNFRKGKIGSVNTFILFQVSYQLANSEDFLNEDDLFSMCNKTNEQIISEQWMFSLV